MNDSPAKKLDFSVANKENNDSGIAVKVVGIPELEFREEPKKIETAPGIKEEEQHEILLQENPNRFVLFPIQHHEVSFPLSHFNASRRVNHGHTLTKTDLAYVQEGHGFLLDSRGDRFVQGHSRLEQQAQQ
jgi:hypothetical protein